MGAFSVGINFIYSWNDWWNDDDDLFIESGKYSDLKEEILNYKYISVEQYKQEILPKAEAYHISNIVKSVKSKWDYEEYGILKDEVMSLDRLICIILYTDYSSLSSDFSSTFRKSNIYEPVQSIKKRNRNYYFMSKLLKETVYVYGAHYDYGLSGPFYCGMSSVINMPQFNISLFSPTSTSTHIQIAMRFGGNKGIIIEFNNDKGRSRRVYGLDVCWLSRFSEEEEVYVDVKLSLFYIFIYTKTHCFCVCLAYSFKHILITI